MTQSENEAFRRSLVRMGRLRTTEDLNRRGIRRVRSISSDDLSHLIERAVNKTIMQRTLSLDPVERDRLSRQAHAELHQLVSQRRRTLRPAAGQETGHEAAVATELQPSRAPSDRGPDLNGRAGLRSVPVNGWSAPADPEDTEDLVGLFRGALEQQQQAIAQREREEEVLRRRIDKLVRELEEAQAAIQASRRRGLEDHGLASIYDGPQGLSDDEPEKQLKEGVLMQIFQENLALRRRLSGDAALQGM